MTATRDSAGRWTARPGRLSARSGRAVAPATGGDTPVGLRVGAGAVLVVAAALASAAVPMSAPWVRLAVVAAVVAGFAAVTADLVATASTVMAAFAVFDGFLVNQLGELSWHGRVDAWRVAALAAAAGAGLGVGHLRGHLDGRRRDRAWAAWLDEITTIETDISTGEERHGA